MKKTTIDCVAMKDEIQARIYEEIKDLSLEQQLSYFRDAVERDAPLSEKYRRLPPLANTNLTSDASA